MLAPRCLAKIVHQVLAAHRAAASNSRLPGSFDSPFLGRPGGLLSCSLVRRSCMFRPFTCHYMNRNHLYWNLPSKHTPKCYYKTLRPTSSTSTSFRTSLAFDFQTLPNFTNRLIMLKYYIQIRYLIMKYMLMYFLTFFLLRV